MNEILTKLKEEIILSDEFKLFLIYGNEILGFNGL